jgi:hypothetical protein
MRGGERGPAFGIHSYRRTTMSRAVNLQLSEADVRARCHESGVSISTMEPLQSGGTHLVCTTSDGADEIRLRAQRSHHRGARAAVPILSPSRPLVSRLRRGHQRRPEWAINRGRSKALACLSRPTERRLVKAARWQRTALAAVVRTSTFTAPSSSTSLRHFSVVGLALAADWPNGCDNGRLRGLSKPSRLPCCRGSTACRGMVRDRFDDVRPRRPRKAGTGEHS